MQAYLAHSCSSSHKRTLYCTPRVSEATLNERESHDATEILAKYGLQLSVGAKFICLQRVGI